MRALLRFAISGVACITLTKGVHGVKTGRAPGASPQQIVSKETSMQKFAPVRHHIIAGVIATVAVLGLAACSTATPEPEETGSSSVDSAALLTEAEAPSSSLVSRPCSSPTPHCTARKQTSWRPPPSAPPSEHQGSHAVLVRCMRVGCSHLQQLRNLPPLP